jgi:hypothetical protein
MDNLSSRPVSIQSPGEAVDLILDPNVRLLAAFDVRQETGER